MKHLSIPRGTRDFSAIELRKRTNILEVIQKNFELFGFSPLETPSFEKLETLSGKYGEEGEQLIFKILDSGDFTKNIKELFYQLAELPSEDEKKEFIEKKLSAKALLGKISHKALRYDLTIPFARYVAMHQNILTFPFKRYQIQAVWRADRPQKGRFREFYQCDVDVIGSTSLWQEFELIKLYDKIFHELHLEVEIQINHRELLGAIAKEAGIENNWNSFVIALDKWDKMGPEKVFEEMKNKGIETASLKKIEYFMDLNSLRLKEKLSKLSIEFENSEMGEKALRELHFIIDKLDKFPLKGAKINLNLSLARGLNYYTGMIFEVLPRGIESSSIGGGGRYDNLTKLFDQKAYPGIGISFGLDRIYLAMETLGIFENLDKNKEILFLNFGESESEFALKWIESLRNQNIKASLYPDAIKIKKQFDYANKNQIHLVGLVGEEEIRQNGLKLKNLETGKEDFCKDIETLLDYLKNETLLVL